LRPSRTANAQYDCNQQGRDVYDPGNHAVELIDHVTLDEQARNHRNTTPHEQRYRIFSSHSLPSSTLVRQMPRGKALNSLPGPYKLYKPKNFWTAIFSHDKSKPRTFSPLTFANRLRFSIEFLRRSLPSRGALEAEGCLRGGCWFLIRVLRVNSRLSLCCCFWFANCQFPIINCFPKACYPCQPRRFSSMPRQSPLCCVLLLAALLTAAKTDLNPAALIYKLPDQIQWKEALPGAKMAVLQGDPDKPGLYIVLIKWSPHSMSRPHFHPHDRFITVLSGTWWVGTGSKFDPESTVPMPAGSFVTHFGKQVHYDGAKDQEAMIEIVGEGPATATPAEAK